MKERGNNDCVLNKVEYTRTVTAVHILLLNYQPNYNYNTQSQYQGVRNQLMFMQRGKTGDDELKQKTIIRNPEENFTKSPAMILEKEDTV